MYPHTGGTKQWETNHIYKTSLLKIAHNNLIIENMKFFILLYIIVY